MSDRVLFLIGAFFLGAVWAAAIPSIIAIIMASMSN